MLIQIGVQIFTEWSTETRLCIQKSYNHIALLQENLESLKAKLKETDRTLNGSSLIYLSPLLTTSKCLNIMLTTYSQYFLFMLIPSTFIYQLWLNCFQSMWILQLGFNSPKLLHLPLHNTLSLPNYQLVNLFKHLACHP